MRPVCDDRQRMDPSNLIVTTTGTTGGNPPNPDLVTSTDSVQRAERDENATVAPSAVGSAHMDPSTDDIAARVFELEQEVEVLRSEMDDHSRLLIARATALDDETRELRRLAHHHEDVERVALRLVVGYLEDTDEARHDILVQLQTALSALSDARLAIVGGQ